MSNNNLTNKDFFIFFGCWNKGYCNLDNPEKSPLSSVVLDIKNSLQDKPIEQRPKLLIVAGDNYYPIKIKEKTPKKGGAAAQESPSNYYDVLQSWRPDQPIPVPKNKSKSGKDKPKKKIFNSKFLHSGMECIRSLNEYFVEGIFMLMGNHDLQYEKYLYSVNGSTPVNGCEIITAQMNGNYPINFNYNEYYRKSNNTLFLFVNSSMYTTEGGDDKIDGDIFECMKKYRPEIYESAKNISDIMTIDEDIINGIVQDQDIISGINNVIICGHEPIVEIKKKELNPVGTVIQGIGNTGFRGLKFFKSIYDRFDHMVDKFYLCADVHNFQEGTIIFNDGTLVKQYVVGTGGTDLDMYDYNQTYSLKETNAAEEEDEKTYQLNNVDPDAKYTETFEPPTSSSDDQQFGLTFTLDNYMLEFGYLKCSIENTLSSGSASEEEKNDEVVLNPLVSKLRFSFKPVIYHGNLKEPTPMTSYSGVNNLTFGGSTKRLRKKQKQTKRRKVNKRKSYKKVKKHKTYKKKNKIL